MVSRRKHKPDSAASADAGALPLTAKAADAAADHGDKELPSENGEPLLLGVVGLAPWRRSCVYTTFSLVAMAAVLSFAYKIRIRSIHYYGYVLHSSDPWFNYRAAEYMSTHGWTAFFRWFDYMSWYPLGRPVGSTTYPGLQFTAVAIHRALAVVGMPMSLNDVCVLIPAWFSLVSSLLVALLAHEMTGNVTMAAISSILFSVVPAHLMRSMAGEFDNECIAVAAMLLVFYFWTRSLRTTGSWPVGALTGIAYGYMVAAWGGYIFVLNMVALHAGVAALVDWARNTYNPSLLRAYALFYVIGTALATRVPPVGMSPFRSLEQLGALVVLLFLSGQALCEMLRIRSGAERFSKQGVALLIRIYAICFVVVVAVAFLAPEGFFEPLSLQALATTTGAPLTGNPLVDLLIARDASSFATATELLLFPFFGWISGLGVFVSSLVEKYSYAKSFLLLYGVVGVYFAVQSVRMIVMVAPVACFFTALLLQWSLDYFLASLFWPKLPSSIHGDATQVPQLQTSSSTAQEEMRKKEADYANVQTRKLMLRMLPLTFLLLAFRLSGFAEDVVATSYEVEVPGILFPNSTVRGKPASVVDDYYAGFLYLRDNTPEDARVLAWWDYGYQITGIGNRTSLADGNTWNHEHIATIGKLLTSPVAEAHALVRHVADYVLIFSGNSYFTDLNRSPMMARIANSVYHDICPNDPLCRKFTFQKKQRLPTSRRGRHAPAPHTENEIENDESNYEASPLMSKSLLYHLHTAGVEKGVDLDEHLFRSVYTSAHGLLRIFKVMNVSEESKAWIADPANRVCDQPGSWICRGQYPPAREIQEMLVQRHTNFKYIVDAMREMEREKAMEENTV